MPGAMYLVRQRPCPFRLRMNLPVLNSGHGADNDPIDSGKGQLCRDRRITLKGNMVMFCLTFFAARIRHSSAFLVTVTPNHARFPDLHQTSKSGRLGMNRTDAADFHDLCKYLVSPFRLPSGETLIVRKKKVLRTFLSIILSLPGKLIQQLAKSSIICQRFTLLRA